MSHYWPKPRPGPAPRNSPPQPAQRSQPPAPDMPKPPVAFPRPVLPSTNTFALNSFSNPQPTHPGPPPPPPPPPAHPSHSGHPHSQHPHAHVHAHAHPHAHAPPPAHVPSFTQLQQQHPQMREAFVHPSQQQSFNMQPPQLAVPMQQHLPQIPTLQQSHAQQPHHSIAQPPPHAPHGQPRLAPPQAAQPSPSQPPTGHPPPHSQAQAHQQPTQAQAQSQSQAQQQQQHQQQQQAAQQQVDGGTPQQPIHHMPAQHPMPHMPSGQQLQPQAQPHNSFQRNPPFSIRGQPPPRSVALLPPAGITPSPTLRGPPPPSHSRSLMTSHGTPPPPQSQHPLPSPDHIPNSLVPPRLHPVRTPLAPQQPPVPHAAAAAVAAAVAAAQAPQYRPQHPPILPSRPGQSEPLTHHSSQAQPHHPPPPASQMQSQVQQLPQPPSSNQPHPAQTHSQSSQSQAQRQQLSLSQPQQGTQPQSQAQQPQPTQSQLRGTASAATAATTVATNSASSPQQARQPQQQEKDKQTGQRQQHTPPTSSQRQQQQEQDHQQDQHSHPPDQQEADQQARSERKATKSSDQDQAQSQKSQLQQQTGMHVRQPHAQHQRSQVPTSQMPTHSPPPPQPMPQSQPQQQQQPSMPQPPPHSQQQLHPYYMPQVHQDMKRPMYEHYPGHLHPYYPPPQYPGGPPPQHPRPPQVQHPVHRDYAPQPPMADMSRPMAVGHPSQAVQSISMSQPGPTQAQTQQNVQQGQTQQAPKTPQASQVQANEPGSTQVISSNAEHSSQQQQGKHSQNPEQGGNNRQANQRRGTKNNNQSSPQLRSPQPHAQQSPMHHETHAERNHPIDQHASKSLGQTAQSQPVIQEQQSQSQGFNKRAEAEGGGGRGGGGGTSVSNVPMHQQSQSATHHPITTSSNSPVPSMMPPPRPDQAGGVPRHSTAGVMRDLKNHRIPGMMVHCHQPSQSTTALKQRPGMQTVQPVPQRFSVPAPQASPSDPPQQPPQHQMQPHLQPQPHASPSVQAKTQTTGGGVQQQQSKQEQAIQEHSSKPSGRESVNLNKPQRGGAVHSNSEHGPDAQPPPRQIESSTQGPNGYRHLKVEDALAYLEQVKQCFQDMPSIYNRFLDIMKEFKAQTIDTSEVIRRVSALFHGHRELILGFNTFLPPGYKIEHREDPESGCITGFSNPGGNFCTLNGDDVGGVNQTQMSGQLTPNVQPDVTHSNVASRTIDISTSPGPNAHGNNRRGPNAGRSRRQGAHDPMGRGDHNYDHNREFTSPGPGVRQTDDMSQIDSRTVAMSGGTSTVKQEYHLSNAPGTVQSRMPDGPQGAQHPQMQQGGGIHQNENAVETLAGGLGSPYAVSGQKTIEFDQAVRYVNKIKSRFSHNELVYKRFLSILQTYQKEQRSMKEVYEQVSELFRDHEDLLNEFSHFLPEATPHAEARAIANRNNGAGGSSAINQRGGNTSATVKKQPVEIVTGEMGSSNAEMAPSQTNSNMLKREKSGKSTGNKSRNTKGRGAGWGAGPAGGIVKNTAAVANKSRGPQKRADRKVANVDKRVGGPGGLPKSNVAGGPVMHSGDGPSSGAPGSGVGGGAMERGTPGLELQFFEELRSALGKEGEQNYAEFIKCLSLFCQEIIGGDELLRLAEGLLQNRKPLADAFRAFLDRNDPNPSETAVALLRKLKNESGTNNANAATNRRPPRSNGAMATPGGAVPSDRQPLVPPTSPSKASGPNEHAKDFCRTGAGSSAGGDRDADVTMRNAEEDMRSGRNAIPNPVYHRKPLSEIGHDFGTKVGGSKSYAKLPSDVGNIPSSGMTADDRTVLNHSFVAKGTSVANSMLDKDPARRPKSGRADGKEADGTGSTVPGGEILSPNGTSGISRYGLGLGLALEEQRMDVDLLISRAQTTVSKLEKVESGEIPNVSSLTGMDLKPIELIYQDASLDMLELLRTNPTVTLPIILQRLKQRIADWHGSRKRLEQIWKTKRFSASANGHPRTWKRSEMMEDLMIAAEASAGEAAASEANTKLMIIDTEDDASNVQAAAGDDATDVDAHSDQMQIDTKTSDGQVNMKEDRTKVRCRLVCEDENLNFIIDILWFAFEWAANGKEDGRKANDGVDFIDRVYKLLQRCEKRGVELFVCEYLYEYIRLVSEASERIKFIVDYDAEKGANGKTLLRMLEVSKDVLTGKMLLSGYDSECSKLFGNDSRSSTTLWEMQLRDLAVILKRLSEAATSMVDHPSAEEMLGMCEESVKTGTNNINNANNLNNNNTNKTSQASRMQKAVNVGIKYSVEVVGVKATVAREVKVMSNAKGKTAGTEKAKEVVKERELGLEFRWIAKHNAGQYEKLDVSNTNGGIGARTTGDKDNKGGNGNKRDCRGDGSGKKGVRSQGVNNNNNNGNGNGRKSNGINELCPKSDFARFVRREYNRYVWLNKSRDRYVRFRGQGRHYGTLADRTRHLMKDKCMRYDGLDARVNDKTGGIKYVSGSHDIYIRVPFKKHRRGVSSD